MIEQPNSMTVREDQPLIGVLVRENGEEVVRYFTDDDEAEQASTPSGVQQALALAGAWKDLGDWDEVEAELDRIRHESKPTPPIDHL